jgi:hypothetical protein
MHVRIDVSLQRPSWARPHRRTRWLLPLVLVACLPGVALAGHLFADVPTDHTFHGNISNLANAGVTAGCGGGDFCPDAAVTRGQMAAFLNRGLGRVAEANVQTTVTGTSQAILGTLTITPGIAPGAGSGATQFLVADFTSSIRFTNVTSCPCSVAVYLTANGNALTSVAAATTVTVANQYTPLSTRGVIAVTGSAPVTVNLIGYYVSGATTTTAYTAYGTMTAQIVPFGGAGASTLAETGGDGIDNELVPPVD